MNRRDFFKVGLMMLTAVLASPNVTGRLAVPLTEARHGDQLYRGTLDGKIYVSEDAGQTWTLHTNFGPGLSIQHLWVNLWGQLQARLGIASHSFELALAKDNKVWRTV